MTTPPTFEIWFHARHPEIHARGVEAVLKLAEGGATVPFIARYRKEQTGNLDEVAIQAILNDSETWDGLIKRQQFIVEEIERQQKLTPELKDRILNTFDAAILEDIYLPYKQKRKTKAALAKEAGLQPLADWLWDVGHGAVDAAGETPQAHAGAFLNAELGFADADAALNGAVEIAIERLSEDTGLRATVRQRFQGDGFLKTKKGAKA